MNTIASLSERILEENRRVHARENARYLDRHPEQTHYFQASILRRTLERLNGLLDSKPSSILDVGCGTGYLFLPLLRAGHAVTGVDLSETLIDVLSSRIPQPDRSRARLVVADAARFLSEGDAAYDAVVASALLHHLYDYEGVVDALCRRVKPGGALLVFFEPLRQKIADPVRYRLHRALGRADESLYEIAMRLRGIELFEEDYELADYQRQFGGIDPLKLAGRVTAAGLEVVALDRYCARRWGPAAWLANRVLKTQNTFNLLARRPRATAAGTI